MRSETSQGGSVETPDSEIDARIPLPPARSRFGDLATIRAAGIRIREQVELHQVIVGIVFGLYPAARAASLNPIIALRHG